MNKVIGNRAEADGMPAVVDNEVIVGSDPNEKRQEELILRESVRKRSTRAGRFYAFLPLRAGQTTQRIVNSPGFTNKKRGMIRSAIKKTEIV